MPLTANRKNIVGVIAGDLNFRTNDKLVDQLSVIIHNSGQSYWGEPTIKLRGKLHPT